MDKNIKELSDVVIRFSGDSGDGMQLTGTLFSDTSALLGNGISTFPDYPAEIRAPQGTVAGVSGFQVHFGSSRMITPGDYCDVLVAMNPAALKANAKWLKADSTVIIDGDTLDEKHIAKAGFKTLDIISELGLQDYNIVIPDITTMTKDALEGMGLDNKSVVKCKNMFALGICFYLYNRPMEHTFEYINTKFAKKNPLVAEANIKVVKAGYNYAPTPTFSQIRSTSSRRASKRARTAASAVIRRLHGDSSQHPEKSGRPLFCGSYPSLRRP